MAECQLCGGRGEVEATPGQPGDGPMPCACQVPEWGEVEKATTAARYLQDEINLMRRVMQDAGTWDQFCADYAAYKERRPWARRIDQANPCTCDSGFDRDCPRHGDVTL